MVKIFVEFFHILARILFTGSETELDDYHQKVKVRVNERLKTDLRKSGNFKEIAETPGMDDEYPAGHQKLKNPLMDYRVFWQHPQ